MFLTRRSSSQQSMARRGVTVDEAWRVVTHRLNSNSSPTFSGPPLEGRRTSRFSYKMSKRRGFTQGCAFCSKNRNFSYPLSSRAPKRSKFCKSMYRTFSLDFAFNNRGPWTEHWIPLILHESDIVYRQCVGKKLNYALKFYVAGTHHVISRMRNDDSALCRGGISRKPLEIETCFQRTTNRKWSMLSRMVTWPLTSHDPKRSRSWPQYVWCPLSRKRLDLGDNGAPMGYGESIGHVTDDVTWPWKVKVVTVICLVLSISKAAEDRNLFPRTMTRKCPIWQVEWSGARWRRMCRSSYSELIT